jgi:hypothetical protein
VVVGRITGHGGTETGRGTAAGAAACGGAGEVGPDGSLSCNWCALVRHAICCLQARTAAAYRIWQAVVRSCIDVFYKHII